MKIVLIFLIVAGTIVLPACQPESQQEVVVYTSVDQIYSEPILKKFEIESGIKILPVFDVEATKTTGLVNRLIAEKERPQADVFWNGEFVQSILLKDSGVLQGYRSPEAANIPVQYRDPESCWTGFAGRARVLLVNTGLVQSQNYPRSLFDLLEPRYKPEQVGIAYPMFGTATTHAAALYAALGNDKGRMFFGELKKRGIRILDGNSILSSLIVFSVISKPIIDIRAPGTP